MIRHSILLSTTLTAFLLGCSDSSAPPPQTKVAKATPPVASGKSSEAQPDVKPKDGAKSQPAPDTQKTDESSSDFVAPFDKKRDLFKAPPAPPPPKKEVIPVVVAEPQPAPVPEDEDTPPPPVRLIGFSEDDDLKAILTVDGKPIVASVGAELLNVSVVSIEPPNVGLKFRDHEWSINLMEQRIKNAPTRSGPVFNEPRPAATPRSQPTNSAPSAATPALALPNMTGVPGRPDVNAPGPGKSRGPAPKPSGATAKAPAAPVHSGPGSVPPALPPLGATPNSIPAGGKK